MTASWSPVGRPRGRAGRAQVTPHTANDTATSTDEHPGRTGSPTTAGGTRHSRFSPRGRCGGSARKLEEPEQFQGQQDLTLAGLAGHHDAGLRARPRAAGFPQDPAHDIDLPVVAAGLRKVAGRIVEGIQGRADVVQFVVIEVGVDVCGHRDQRVAHRLLKETQVGPGAARLRRVRVRRSCTRGVGRPISTIEFRFRKAYNDFQAEVAERGQPTQVSTPFGLNVAIPSYQRPFYHSVTEHIEWQTDHGTPKLAQGTRRVTAPKSSPARHRVALGSVRFTTMLYVCQKHRIMLSF